MVSVVVQHMLLPLLLYTPLIALLYAVQSYLAQLRQRTKFERFEEENCCEKPAAIKTLPLVGGVVHKLRLLLSTADHLLDTVFVNKYKQYGDTHALYNGGTQQVVHTVDPAILHAILTTKSADWKIPESRKKAVKPLAQTGIVLTDGEEWHRNRKAVQRNMNPKDARNVLRNEADIQRVFLAIGEEEESGWTEEVDLADVFHRMALDMTTSYLLGSSANAQIAGIARDRVKRDPTVEAVSSIDDVYDTLSAYFAWRGKLGSLYWIADTPQYRRACRDLTEHFRQIITDTVERRKENPGQKERVFLDALLDDLADPVKTHEIIIDLFIGGQNMVGATTAWLFACLERNPDVVRDIRAEVLETFGTESSPKAPFSWKALQNCQTLQNAINETMRLYPLLANLGRNARCDTVLPRGGGKDGMSPVAVPEGGKILVNIYLIHRSKEYWGEDADEFRPSRWIGRRTGPEFSPFGNGPRQCVGQALSYAEISYVTARFFQRYSELRAPLGQDNLVKDISVIMRPKYGVKMRMKRA